jgi:hypothetical protein
VNSVYLDPAVNDSERRRLLYAGQILVYSPTPSSLGLVRFAREMIEEAFEGLDPELAQHEMPVEEYATLLSKLKPRFIHHPKSKEFIAAILAELGCDLTKTYLDVPRMRTSTSENYLTSGIAYAFHPHRDTWYSAPMCQVNFWLPIYPIQSNNGLAFHPRYWAQGVKNGSRDHNYHHWTNTARFDVLNHIHSDTRKQPKPEEEMELDPQVRLLPQPGGLIVFSGSQMHSSVPNDSGRTRFSIDFRTVHLDDVVGHLGAPNVDSECTGTNLRDFLRGTDHAQLDEELCLEYENGTPLATAADGARAGG